MNLLRLFDIATLGGGWKTAPMDVQYQIVEEEGLRILALQGTWSYIDVGIDLQFWPSRKAGWFPAGIASLFGILNAICLCEKPDLITGWSLGGMEAMFCASIGFQGRIVTFGDPAIWPRWIKENPTSRILHVVHRADGLIPWYPAILYRRPGAVLEIGDGKDSLFKHDISAYRAALERLPL